MKRKAGFTMNKIILFILLAVFACPCYAESIDPNDDGSQYAYGQNIGWLNFEPNQGPGVIVTTEQIAGYVWVPNIG